MEFQILKEKLSACILRFCLDQAKLLIIDVQEQSITNALSKYLEVDFNELGLDINVDFNKRIVEDVYIKKQLDFLVGELHHSKMRGGEFINEAYYRKAVLPDIIFHDIKTSANNFLVIEIKKSTNKNKQDRDFDILKLQVFTRDDLSYQFGAFIEFKTGEEYDEQAPFCIRYFINGVEM